MTDDRTEETHVVYRGSSAAVYCVNLSDMPEVAGGQTISLPTISVVSGPALVTFSGEVVTVADFNEYNANGNLERVIPAGKGVKFAMTPAAVGSITKGECVGYCSVAFSGGGRDGKQFKIVVK